MIRPLTVVLILAGLAACTGGRAGGSNGGPPPQEPYRSGLIRTGHWGVGPIRVGTPFERRAIQALFPGAKVRHVTLIIDEDETQPGIIIEQDGREILEIEDAPGSTVEADNPLIGAVRALDGRVRGPSGETLSMSWAAAHFDLSQCETGVARDRNTVICARRGEGAVTFYFAVPGWDSEELPPESLLRKVGYLRAIVWSPPPPRNAASSES